MSNQTLIPGENDLLASESIEPVKNADGVYTITFGDFTYTAGLGELSTNGTDIRAMFSILSRRGPAQELN